VDIVEVQNQKLLIPMKREDVGQMVRVLTVAEAENTGRKIVSAAELLPEIELP